MTRAMIRWNPRADLFRNSVSRLFDESFNDFISPLGEESGLGNWKPAVDIHESDDALTFTAEMAGLSKDDVEIMIDGDLLTFRGERKFERDEEKENYHRIERGYGTFTRSFSLPNNVETARADAKVEDGVLTVTFPKTEESKARKLDIK